MNFFILILLLVTLILYIKKRNRITIINSNIPGPSGIPFFGNIVDISGERHLKFQQYYKQYGSVFRIRYGFNGERVVLTGYDTLKEAFIEKSDLFKSRYITKRKFFGNLYSVNKFQGFVMSNGEYHTNLKSVIQSQLTSTKIQRMEQHVNEECARLCELLEKRSNEGKEILMNKYLNLFALNITLRFVFGINFPYDDLNDSSVQVIDILQEFFKLSSYPILSDYLPFPHPFPDRPAKHYKLYGKLAKAILDMIEQYKSNKDGADCDDEHGAIIEKLLLEFDKGNITKLGLITICTELFMAGGDTVAQTLMYTIIELVNNQSIQEKLYHEIKNSIPTNENYSYSKYKSSIPYLSLVVKESFRKNPASLLGVSHELAEDCEIQGFKIAKGTQIIQNIYSTHRDDKYWDKPNEFIPERFLSTEKDSVQLVHFGLGPRNCLGSSLALIELTSAIASLILNFQFVNPNPTNQLNDSGNFGVTYSAPPTYILLKKR